MDKALENAISAANGCGLTDAQLATVVEAATATHRADASRHDLVAMAHPGLPPVFVDPGALEVHEQAGWKVAADESEPDEPPVAAPPAPTKATAKTKDKEAS